MDAYSDHKIENPGQPNRSLAFLQPQQVLMIDEALSALGEYGEVRLVVEKGRLRFIVTQKSYDAYKWQPGSMTNEAQPERGK
jgi:hypothetical protein